MRTGEIITFETPIPQLGVESRRVWVYLPPGYGRRGRWPVLYMHDGQNLFDPETSYAGDWGVHRVIDGLCAKGLTRGAIVAGVDNGGDERWNEYSPWCRPEGGGRCRGADYADFLADTLKPRMDAEFRTLPGRADTGVAGSSLGGTISWYALLARGETFGLGGMFSPAFWFAGRRPDALLRSARLRPGARVYFDAGTREGSHEASYVGDAARLAGLCARRPGVSVNLVIDAGGEHNEAAWARRFPAAFLWLLNGR